MSFIPFDQTYQWKRRVVNRSHEFCNIKLNSKKWNNEAQVPRIEMRTQIPLHECHGMMYNMHERGRTTSHSGTNA